MKNQVVNRLSQVLRKYKRRLGSWTKLRAAIAKANDKAPEEMIDRRTLERLCGDDWDDVQVRIRQLIEVDTFLIARGEESIFTKDRTVIDSIAESLDVNFLIAARKYKGVVDYAVSRWDLRATTRLMRTRLNQLRVRIWDIADTVHWSNGDDRLKNSPNIGIGKTQKGTIFTAKCLGTGNILIYIT